MPSKAGKHNTSKGYMWENKKKQATTTTAIQYLKLNHSVKTIKDSVPVKLLTIRYPQDQMRRLDIRESLKDWFASSKVLPKKAKRSCSPYLSSLLDYKAPINKSSIEYGRTHEMPNKENRKCHSPIAFPQCIRR